MTGIAAKAQSPMPPLAAAAPAAASTEYFFCCLPKEKLKVESKQSQKERFIETAKKLEVDESGKTFEMAFSKIVKEKKPRKTFG